MSYRFTVDDIRYLTAPEAAGPLATDLAEGRLLGDLERLHRTAGDRAAAVVETILLRRRAAQRWGGVVGAPGQLMQWLFTDTALQQASPPPVAAHRARRLATLVTAHGKLGVHDLTCSIGTDLLALHRAGINALGSDIDPVRLAVASHNLAVEQIPALLTRADARTVTSRGMIRYADPARRDSTGRRITGADTIPSVAALDAADPTDPPVLRLPPAIDYEALARDSEIEIVSWRGTVREAVSWPDWAATAKRRATILRDGTGDGPEQYVDTEPAVDDVIRFRADAAIGRFLVDPDHAVVRAHLVRQYAARHGLDRIDPHLAYLIGDSPPVHTRSFRILEVAPFHERTVRGWIRRDGVGTLEIKQRGTSVKPDVLRQLLKPAGDRHIARTLVIARIGRGSVAFLTVAEEPGAAAGELGATVEMPGDTAAR